jgi:hypothetical protein
MATIKRVDVVSAMKIGALVSALVFTAFGVFIMALQLLVINSFSSSYSSFSGPSGANLGAGFAMAGLASCLCFYIVGVVASAIFGGIYWAVVAWFYNLVSNWVGGLRIELDQPMLDKPKRDTVADEL